jgi:hypothetical protein
VFYAAQNLILKIIGITDNGLIPHLLKIKCCVK